jgi:hypothetical protein
VKEALGSVADPDPGLFSFLIPGSGIGNNQDPDPGSGSEMNNLDHISESLKKQFFGLKNLSSLVRIRMEKFGSGMEKIWIRVLGLTSRIRNTCSGSNIP